MKYCKKCLMPDTRPNIYFYDDGICAPCKNYEKQKGTDWKSRKKELEILCDKYRGKYGNGYDCAIAVSGGKDSHFQVYYIKEVMGMNPVLLTVSNVDWTETGKRNILNLSDAFSCDIISINPNVNVFRKIAKKALIQLGSPTWYIDSLIYAYPYRMTMQLGLHLLIYGEDINYTYGGELMKETPSAMMQSSNDVVKSVGDMWRVEGGITEKELNSCRQPSLKKCQDHGLDPVYLSYFIPWNSHSNYEFAKKMGFDDLRHEHIRESTFEQYDQIDTLSYLLHPWLKYPKFGHASATDYASKWIRYGMKTREEMIPIVEEHDGFLDQEVVNIFCEFIRMGKREFWSVVDKWYNPDLFKKDNRGIFRPKFKVGVGIVS
jgi:N-acetyl sugar amidotransferase